MITLLVVSFILATAFPGAVVCWTDELPESMSSLVYRLQAGGLRWLWTIWLWVVSFLLAPALMESIPEAWQAVGFLTLLCLFLTGAMPIFMKEHKRAHDAFGIAAGILSQVCVILACAWWLLLWMVMAALVTGAFMSFKDDHGTPKFVDGKGVFVAEALCAMALYGAVLTAVL